jgi:hypothetical protein
MKIDAFPAIHAGILSWFAKAKRQNKYWYNNQT